MSSFSKQPGLPQQKSDSDSSEQFKLVTGHSTMYSFNLSFSRDTCDHCVVCLQGVTYCGDSKSSTLTMKNIPWHEEVVSFVQQLADLLLDYDIASEHEHSNCILIAHTKVHCTTSHVNSHHTHQGTLHNITC